MRQMQMPEVSRREAAINSTYLRSYSSLPPLNTALLCRQVVIVWLNQCLLFCHLACWNRHRTPIELAKDYIRRIKCTCQSFSIALDLIVHCREQRRAKSHDLHRLQCYPSYFHRPCNWSNLCENQTGRSTKFMIFCVCIFVFFSIKMYLCR